MCKYNIKIIFYALEKLLWENEIYKELNSLRGFDNDWFFSDIIANLNTHLFFL